VAVAEAYLDAIAARETEVRAFVFLDRDLVLAQARALDRRKGSERLRLHGVPFAVKDIIDTRDQPTECNSPIYRGRRPRADAECVAAVRAAGALILGKTVTTEFAGLHRPTRNPRDPARTPGGSSSDRHRRRRRVCHSPSARKPAARSSPRVVLRRGGWATPARSRSSASSPRPRVRRARHDGADARRYPARP
jgi:hypothetical protein